MKKIFIRIIIFILLTNIIFICLYNIPRNNTLETFKKLKYGDGFIYTILILGKPSHISEGGNFTLYYHYDLENDIDVSIAFNRKILYLIGCRVIKNRDVIEDYIEKENNTKEKILTVVENSYIGTFLEIIKNIFIGFLID